MHFGKILEFEAVWRWRDRLCDEFVSWTNYFERRLAFAVREIRWVEDLRTFERVACFNFFEYGLETAGLLERWRVKKEGVKGCVVECFVSLSFDGGKVVAAFENFITS